MVYRIEWASPALKDLRRLDPQVARRVALAVSKLAADPLPPASTGLVGEPAGTRRLRVGDYRVVYVVAAEELLVTVVRARHRREVYR